MDAGVVNKTVLAAAVRRSLATRMRMGEYDGVPTSSTCAKILLAACAGFPSRGPECQGCAEAAGQAGGCSVAEERAFCNPLPVRLRNPWDSPLLHLGVVDSAEHRVQWLRTSISGFLA